MKKYLALIVLLCAAAPASDPDVRELFEKARIMAANNQDLAEAIRLFGQVVSLARTQRALAAQAQFQQGILYERLGRKAEATRAFRALISDFLDQSGVVELARAKLPPAPADLGRRRVWAEGVDMTGGSVSPDGRLVSFTDWKTGDLMVHDLETKEDHRLTRNTRFTRPDFQYATSSAFSRDGRLLAYAWSLAGADFQPMEIRLIGRNGSGQRTFFRDSSANWLTVEDWTPDGKYILVTALGDKATTLVLISVADASSREIRVSKTWDGSRVTISRDGRYAAYNAQRPNDSGESEIRVISLGTGLDMALLDREGDEVLLGWSPLRNEIVFRANWSGAPDIWSVRVGNGRADGSPERLVQNVDPAMTPLGITDKGTLMYSLDRTSSELYLADIDPISGNLTTPKIVSESYTESKRSPAWSPDGTRLVYAVKGTPLLRLRNVVTGVESDIQPELSRIIRVLEWHADGQSVFVQGTDKRGKLATFRIALENGAATAVMGVDENVIFSHDSQTVYTRTKDPGGILWRNLATGEERVIYRRAVGSELVNPKLSLSPDEQTLAFQLSGYRPNFTSLALAPVKGGEPRILLEVRNPGLFGYRSFAWTRDMRYIYTARNLDHHGEIWRIPVDGSPAQSAGVSMPGAIRHLLLNPDGRKFVFTRDRTSEEVWILEDFLSGSAPGPPARR